MSQLISSAKLGPQIRVTNAEVDEYIHVTGGNRKASSFDTWRSRRSCADPNKSQHRARHRKFLVQDLCSLTVSGLIYAPLLLPDYPICEVIQLCGVLLGAGYVTE